jgi:hypothetical protein
MSTNKSLRASILEMGIGESLSISLDSYGYTTIRSYASELGFATGRTYRTRRNREDRTQTITRIA